MHSLQKELQMTVNPLKLHYLMASRLMLNLGRLLLIKSLVELGMILFCDTLKHFQTALCMQVVTLWV